ncbi:MAG TPA: metallophosphoesterase [Acidimicrobiales bacterium]|nr:metallophosphoesterase [Acidimicrobiales bacterium]
MWARRVAVAAGAGVLATMAAVAAGCGGPSRTARGSGSPPTTRTTTAATATTTSSTPPTGTPGATATSTTPAGPGITVVAAGDIACAPGAPPSPSECQQAATADLAASLHPDAVIAAGDLQYDAGARRAFDASYAPSWGRLRDLTHPAVGNHEYGTSHAAGYFGYWGDRAGAPGKGWYSWDLGGWHFVALDSDCSIVGCGEGSAQLAWLRADLATSSATCTLAYWHHPRFSSGLHGDDASVDPLWRALVAAHADIVVSGHDHDYERFASKDGLRQFVVGTGGRNLYPVLKPEAGSQAVAERFGVLRLTLSAASYAWEFHAIGGDVLDRGTAPCG